MPEGHLHSLDDAFLFLIGSVNFMFGALQAFVGGKDSFILFSPLLLAGLFYPFYTGYLGGAVERDSIVERIRGWIYFGVGAISYVALLPVALLRDFYQEAAGLSVVTYLLTYLLGYYGIYRLVRWLLVVTRAQPSKRDLFLLEATALSAYSLSVSAFFLQDYLRIWILRPKTAELPYLPGIFSVLWPFALFLLMERTIETALSRDGIIVPEVYESNAPIVIAFNGSVICLVNGLLSNAVALWLGILSYALLMLATFFRLQIQFWLQVFALLFAVLALMKYATSPISIIRTREDFRNRIRQILRIFDC